MYNILLLRICRRKAQIGGCFHISWLFFPFLEVGLYDEVWKVRFCCVSYGPSSWKRLTTHAVQMASALQVHGSLYSAINTKSARNFEKPFAVYVLLPISQSLRTFVTKAGNLPYRHFYVGSTFAGVHDREDARARKLRQLEAQQSVSAPKFSHDSQNRCGAGAPTSKQNGAL